VSADEIDEASESVVGSVRRATGEDIGLDPRDKLEVALAATLGVHELIHDQRQERHLDREGHELTKQAGHLVVPVDEDNQHRAATPTSAAAPAKRMTLRGGRAMPGLRRLLARRHRSILDVGARRVQVAEPSVAPHRHGSHVTIDTNPGGE
jgi:hypothetical protein